MVQRKWFKKKKPLKIPSKIPLKIPSKIPFKKTFFSEPFFFVPFFPEPFFSDFFLVPTLFFQATFSRPPSKNHQNWDSRPARPNIRPRPPSAVPILMIFLGGAGKNDAEKDGSDKNGLEKNGSEKM